MPNEPGIGPNWWWMSTSTGRFATGIGMSTTTDAATNQANWYITSLARNVYFLAVNCPDTDQPYTADPTLSVDQDLILLHFGSPSLSYGANLIVDIYIPDFSQTPTNHSFLSSRQAGNGTCVNSTTGSLKSRPANRSAQSVTFTNALELRY
jgi:hypothetical protein